MNRRGESRERGSGEVFLKTRKGLQMLGLANLSYIGHGRDYFFYL